MRVFFTEVYCPLTPPLPHPLYRNAFYSFPVTYIYLYYTIYMYVCMLATVACGASRSSWSRALRRPSWDTREQEKRPSADCCSASTIPWRGWWEFVLPYGAVTLYSKYYSICVYTGVNVPYSRGGVRFFFVIWVVLVCLKGVLNVVSGGF